MISYLIELEDSVGQRGWYGMIDGDGRLLVFHEPDNAVRYLTEEEAEAALYQIEETYGVDREEARIHLMADDRTATVTLGGPYHDDGLEVVEEKGQRYITRAQWRVRSQ